MPGGPIAAYVARLHALLVEIDAGIDDLLGALDGLDRAIARLAQTSGSSTRLLDAIGHLEAAKALLREAIRRGHQSKRRIVDYTDLVEHGRGRSGASGSALPVEPPAPSAVGPAVQEPVGRDAPIPAYVAAIARALRVPSGSKVGGVLVNRAGVALHAPDKPLVNGKRGGVVDNAASLRGDDPVVPWRHLDSALTHVEGHAAALLRQPDAPTEAVLVLTRQPCADRPFGCHRILPSLLPEGTVLHVYVTHGHTVDYFDSYRGTGRGVKR